MPFDTNTYTHTYSCTSTSHQCGTHSSSPQ